MLFVSLGCPAGVGPEVSVAAALRMPARVVLVGSRIVVAAAASSLGVGHERLVAFDGRAPKRGQIAVCDPGPTLSARDYRPGRPSKLAGRAALSWIDAAVRLTREHPKSAMVTGPVSKASIANSGARGAAGFRGHTEHIEKLLGSPHSVMCFYTPGFSTSLVTTHLPVKKATRAITPERVCIATVELAEFLRALGIKHPKIAVASLNPHAGEAELLGREESTAIIPGLRLARRRLRGGAELSGPIGAETAYRVAHGGGYHGVVGMLHDQATIPTKLVAFGDAVNVTLGLPIIRTSVDHGTAYDIAWQRKADPEGMLAAMQLAHRLLPFSRVSGR